MQPSALPSTVGHGVALSTFRRRINAGEDKATCFREEFPKWVERRKRPHAWLGAQT